MATRSTANPTPAEAISAALRQVKADIRVSLPGRVEAYDPATQLVDVLPLLTDADFNSETDDFDSVALPVIPQVPLAFAGAETSFASFPVKVGSYVLLSFVDRSLDQWYRGDGGQTDPVDLRQHDLTDAVALPVRITPASAALADVHPDNIVIGFDADTQIHIKPSGIVALNNENPNDNAAAASITKSEIEAVRDTLDSLVTQFNSFISTFNAHTHPTAGMGAPSPPTVPATESGTAPAAVGDVKTDNVLLEL